ncbi:protein ALP1-like isoform X1 [Euphorbia lathyris]|uniref:protein ALP1-like isoform X1 n=1 Tax=Euphorbia lathyris TaxID=212925 RepID=UPI0033130B9F
MEFSCCQYFYASAQVMIIYFIKMDDKVKLIILMHHLYKLAGAQVVCVDACWYMRRRRLLRNNIAHMTHEIKLESERVRGEILDHLSSSNLCHNVIRISYSGFTGLCDLLIREGGLRPTIQASVEEQVIKTLWLLGHNVSQRELALIFRRSSETVSRHFHNVLDAIIELFFKQPDGTHIPFEIFSHSKFYPYFKDCVGAIDGTHVRVKVSNTEAPRYRGRKEYPTQNVLAACTFDLKFTYVLAGWEGTASDSRIIKHALSREFPLKMPEGKYYLVDAGFMLRRGLITPYRGERYHLKEYSRNAPRNARELFNLRHASLRNAIERCFGVLKKRFPIIGSGTEPNYCVNTQNKIIVACCILHNYMIGVDPNDAILEQVDEEILNWNNSEDEQHNARENNEETRQGEIVRDLIAADMWVDYIR